MGKKKYQSMSETAFRDHVVEALVEQRKRIDALEKENVKLRKADKAIESTLTSRYATKQDVRLTEGRVHRHLVECPEYRELHQRLQAWLLRDAIYTELHHLAAKHGNDTELAQVTRWLYSNWDASSAAWKKLERFKLGEIMGLVQKNEPLERPKNQTRRPRAAEAMA